MFLVCVRKGVYTAPFLDAKNFILKAREKQISVYSCKFPFENFCFRNVRSFYPDILFEEFIDYQRLIESEMEETYGEAKVFDGLVDSEVIFHCRVNMVVFSKHDHF